jgi:hypothetical protein
LVLGFSFYSSINYNIKRYKKIEIKTIKTEISLYSKNIRYILPINCITILIFGTIIFNKFIKTFFIMFIIIILILSLTYIKDLSEKKKKMGK